MSIVTVGTSAIIPCPRYDPKLVSEDRDQIPCLESRSSPKSFKPPRYRCHFSSGADQQDTHCTIKKVTVSEAVQFLEFKNKER